VLISAYLGLKINKMVIFCLLSRIERLEMRLTFFLPMGLFQPRFSLELFTEQRGFLREKNVNQGT
jgi:hypothetical protein